MNADGSGQRRLTQRGEPAKLAWSPDGDKIAFVSRRDGDAEIYVMNADGSGQRRLTRTGARQRPRLVARRPEDRLREQLAGLRHERRRQPDSGG